MAFLGVRAAGRDVPPARIGLEHEKNPQPQRDELAFVWGTHDSPEQSLRRLLKRTTIGVGRAIRASPGTTQSQMTRQIGFTPSPSRGRILLVGNFFLWPLCDFPDFCLRGTTARTPPGNLRVFPHDVMRGRGLSGRVDRFFCCRICPLTFPLLLRVR